MAGHKVPQPLCDAPQELPAAAAAESHIIQDERRQGGQLQCIGSVEDQMERIKGAADGLRRHVERRREEHRRHREPPRPLPARPGAPEVPHKQRHDRKGVDRVQDGGRVRPAGGILEKQLLQQRRPGVQKGAHYQQARENVEYRCQKGPQADTRSKRHRRPRLTRLGGVVPRVPHGVVRFDLRLDVGLFPVRLGLDRGLVRVPPLLVQGLGHISILRVPVVILAVLSPEIARPIAPCVSLLCPNDLFCHLYPSAGASIPQSTCGHPSSLYWPANGMGPGLL